MMRGVSPSPELQDVARHYRRVEPLDSWLWKRASLLFAIAAIFVGFVGSVAWELLDRRRGC